MKIAQRDRLKSPKEQKTVAIGRLKECGQNSLDPLEVSSPSASSSLLRLGELTMPIRELPMTGSTIELSELDATETGLEFLDESKELASEGQHSRRLGDVFSELQGLWVGALIGLRHSCCW